MRAGRLRHRVTLQSATATRNSFGENIEAWTDVITVWAAVEPLRGTEYFASDRIKSETDVRVVLRYVDGVHPGMRVLFETRIFDIESVIDRDSRGRELELMCKERVGSNLR